MFFVVCRLLGTSPLGLVDGLAHRVGDAVAVEDRLAVGITCGPPHRLDQRTFGAQEAFLVGVEDRHQRHLGNIQPLAQQVDTDQHVELAQAQVADDLDPLHRVDVRVQVAHLDVVFVEILGQVFRHPLGQGGDQHPLAHGGAQTDLRQQVVHLGRGRTHLDLGIQQAGGTYHLLHHLAGVLGLVGTRRGRDEDGLGRDPLPLLELHRTVVQGRRQAETVLDQGLLARAVAAVHAAHLGHTDVGLVDEQQRVGGQVVEEGGRRLAGVASGQVARVVLDTVAVAQLQHHFDIVEGTLLQALGLDQTVFLAQEGQSLDQLLLDPIHRRQDGLPRGHVVALGVDGHARHLAAHLAGQRIEQADGVDLVVEQLHPDRLILGVGREDIDDVATHPIGTALEVHVIAGVLQFRQTTQKAALIDQFAAGEVQAHLQILVRITQAVDRRHRHHDQRIATLKQGLGRRQSHLLDMVIDRGVLLDEGVRRGHIGLGLVVVVVGNEVLHSVVREERLELPVQLGRQGLVRRHDDGRPLQPLDDVGHGEGLARTGHPEQGLVGQARIEPPYQAFDSARLVTGRLELRRQTKGLAHHDSCWGTPPRSGRLAPTSSLAHARRRQVWAVGASVRVVISTVEVVIKRWIGHLWLISSSRASRSGSSMP